MLFQRLKQKISWHYSFNSVQRLFFLITRTSLIFTPLWCKDLEHAIVLTFKETELKSKKVTFSKNQQDPYLIKRNNIKL